MRCCKGCQLYYTKAQLSLCRVQDVATGSCSLHSSASSVGSCTGDSCLLCCLCLHWCTADLLEVCSFGRTCRKGCRRTTATNLCVVVECADSCQQSLTGLPLQGIQADPTDPMKFFTQQDTTFQARLLNVRHGEGSAAKPSLSLAGWRHLRYHTGRVLASRAGLVQAGDIRLEVMVSRHACTLADVHQ